MLEKGALPFLPDYCLEGLEISPEIQALLSHARSRYKYFGNMSASQKSGH